MLKHRFLKNAKKNSVLVEPIERYQKWRQKGNGDEEDDDEPYAARTRTRATLAEEAAPF